MSEGWERALAKRRTEGQEVQDPEVGEGGTRGSQLNTIVPTSPTFNAEDPVVVAMEERASQLSMALTPGAIARKLREELVATVGPDKAVAYYIGASTTDGKNIKFEIARMGPRFLARLTGDTTGAELQLAHETTTSGGWRVSVGVAASTSFEKPKGARMQGAFSVTIAR